MNIVVFRVNRQMGTWRSPKFMSDEIEIRYHGGRIVGVFGSGAMDWLPVAYEPGQALMKVGALEPCAFIGSRPVMYGQPGVWQAYLLQSGPQEARWHYYCLQCRYEALGPAGMIHPYPPVKRRTGLGYEPMTAELVSSEADGTLYVVMGVRPEKEPEEIPLPYLERHMPGLKLLGAGMVRFGAWQRRFVVLMSPESL